jgi:secreted PhoX family phosphatase
VLSIEILNNNRGVHKAGQAVVRTYCSNSGTPKNLDFPSTTGTLGAPDNLAMDALGNIYVIEDAPNSSSTGGDIWFVRDTNNDGVAESLDHFLSLRVNGSEATGMIFNPAVPTEFHVAVQHPSSTDLTAVPSGFGDAIWTFNLENIPNQDFLRSLKRGRLRTLTNQ